MKEQDSPVTSPPVDGAAPRQTFFYHSFPRRKGDDAAAHGIRILDSICRNGLLLTPEEVKWVDPTVAPGPDAIIKSVQRRVCFTLLERNELPAHASVFGEFALEFTVEALRSLGALPVMYVPDKINEAHLREAIGTSLLAHLTAAATTIGSLADTLADNERNLLLTLTIKDGRKFTEQFGTGKAKAIKKYLRFLETAQLISFRETHAALMSMASIFYPSENLRYTESLAYYQQREWRIISGLLVNGKSATAVATNDQAEELLRLDSTFFSREISFPDGKFTIAAKSHYLRTIDGVDILSKVNRIIAPPASTAQATQILERYNLEIPVGPL